MSALKAGSGGGSATITKKNKNRKVLLMGKSGAGKSSMRSIVFSNYVARDVRRLGATIDVEHSNIRFMGNLMLNLWDCGGQDHFIESYLTSQSNRTLPSESSGGRAGGQREHIFANVAVLIFVFDVENRDFSADVANYTAIVRALGENTPTAQVFVLVHKMDLVQMHLRDRLFSERSAHIRDHSESFRDTVEFFPTSIWDQSLYKAWTAVIYTLVPNASAIEQLLSKLANMIDARELILYERTTCLTITTVTRDAEADNPFKDRFERLSAMLKTHKHSLAKHSRTPASSAHFGELEIKTSRFMLIACRLTENTNLAAVLPSSEMGFNAAKQSIARARKRFIELDTAVPGMGKQRLTQEAFMAGAARDLIAKETAERDATASGKDQSRNSEQNRMPAG